MYIHSLVNSTVQSLLFIAFCQTAFVQSLVNSSVSSLLFNVYIFYYIMLLYTPWSIPLSTLFCSLFIVQMLLFICSLVISYVHSLFFIVYYPNAVVHSLPGPSLSQLFVTHCLFVYMLLSIYSQVHSSLHSLLLIVHCPNAVVHLLPCPFLSPLFVTHCPLSKCCC